MASALKCGKRDNPNRPMHQTTIPSGLLSHTLLAQAMRQKQVVAGDRGRSAKIL